MKSIFKNMLPYWKTIVIVIALLFVQAWCDLSLPAYTSDIIDVGIQNMWCRSHLQKMNLRWHSLL